MWPFKQSKPKASFDEMMMNPRFALLMRSLEVAYKDQWTSKYTDNIKKAKIHLAGK